MKAAFLTEPKKIKINDIQMPEPKSGEALIEIKSCGVCATDVKKYSGASQAPFYPFILGHEPAGIITAINGDPGIFAVGSRVAIAPVVTCGACPHCASGRTEGEGMGMCNAYQVIGFSTNGAFCETAAVPIKNLVKLPEDLSFKHAALIEPVAACANAVLRSLAAPPGLSVVLGAGFMGLVTLQICRQLGCRALISDPIAERLALAETLGADFTNNPAAADLNAQVMEITHGQGADSVILAVGNKKLTDEGIRLLRKGGRIVLMASGGSNDLVEFNLNEVHYRQPVITGSVSYTKASYQWALELLAQGRIKADALITETGGLDDVDRLLELTMDHVGIKNVMLI
jgi:threonine dehydrogenase-like Zn-dependent dehydrogenase